MNESLDISAGASDDDPDRADAPHRVLVVANETIRGRALLEEIERRAAGPSSEVRVIAPALTGNRLEHGMGDVDGPMALARGRLEESLEQIRDRGIEVTGEVGDADPNLAIEDALRAKPADELIIATHPQERSNWLESDVVGRAGKLGLPITHVVVDLEAERGEEAVAVERDVGARPPPQDRPIEPDHVLARFTPRDWLVIAIAAGGTAILAWLASDCSGQAISDFGTGCPIRLLLAIGVGTLAFWQIIGLTLFESVGYRGPWATAGSDVILFGVPPAVIVAALI